MFFYGGIDVQETLPWGKTEDVRAEVRSRIWEMGHGGGFLLSSSHRLEHDVPIENTLAMIEASGEIPQVIHYLETPPSRERLLALLAMMQLPPRALLRQKGTPYDELQLDDPTFAIAALGWDARRSFVRVRQRLQNVSLSSTSPSRSTLVLTLR